MNPTPATDKIKTCCTSLTCGKVLLVNAARWKEGLSCPLCKKGTLVKLESTKTPMVPVVPVRVVASPQPVAPARIDEVPVVPVRAVAASKPIAPARTEAVPVVPVVTPLAPPDSVPTVTLAEDTPAPTPTLVQAAPEEVLMGELVEEEPSGAYSLEGLKSPPRCPNCMKNLKPNTERCPQCKLDFRRGDWQSHLEDRRKLEEEVREQQRRAEALKSDQELREEQEAREEAAMAAFLGKVFNP